MFKNNETKQFTIYTILIFVVVVTIGSFFTLKQLKKIDETYKNQLIYLIATEINHPELPITESIKIQPNTQQINEAKEKLAQMGIMDFSTTIYNQSLKEQINNLKTMTIIQNTILLLLIYILGMFLFKRIFKKINHLTNQMNLVVHNNLDVQLDHLHDGDLALLSTQFYEVVRILKEKEEREKKEKIYLKDLISDISHQLKTPLSSLIVFNDLLLTDIENLTEQQFNLLSQSTKQLERMEWLTLSLLKLASLEANTNEFKRNETNILNTIQESIDSIDSKLKEKNQHIVFNSISSIELYHNKNWTKEALINLLKNASDYSSEDSVIEVNVEDNKLYTVIKIKDYGIGMEPKDLTKIFQRFYKVNNELNTNSIGIGLALSKKIIENQNGTIEVNSKKGEYTEFIITFLKTIV